MNKIDMWLNAILTEDGHKLSDGSLRTIEMIRREFAQQQNNGNPIVVRSFLVLTHCGAFVDGNMLEKGIYTTQTPRLYDMVTTIDGLIEAGRIMKDFAGNNFISERYFENLSQCTLSEVTLSLK